MQQPRTETVGALPVSSHHSMPGLNQYLSSSDGMSSSQNNKNEQPSSNGYSSATPIHSNHPMMMGQSSLETHRQYPNNGGAPPMNGNISSQPTHNNYYATNLPNYRVNPYATGIPPSNPIPPNNGFPSGSPSVGSFGSSHFARHNTPSTPNNPNHQINFHQYASQPQGIPEFIDSNMNRVSPSYPNTSFNQQTSYLPSNNFISNINPQHNLPSNPSEISYSTDNYITPSMMVAGNTNAEFHPIACVGCRSMHKQCNRRLPSCDRCESKGITCEYKTPRRMRYPNQKKQIEAEEKSIEPKKKKKKTSEIKDEKGGFTDMSVPDTSISTPSNTSLISEIPATLSKKSIIELYYKMICDHFIIMDRNELEKYILGKNIEENELPYKKEMQIFFLSIQCLCEQRLGMGDQAEKTAKKARDAISKYFDEFSNYIIACAYCNLGCFELGNGRPKHSRFYINNVKFYFDEMDENEKQNMNDFQKALKTSLSSISLVNKDNDMGVSTMIQDIPKVFEITTGHQLPQEIVKATLQEVSSSNCIDYLNMVEMIAHYLNKFFRSIATKTRTEEEMEKYDKGSTLCYSIILNGLRVGVLTKAGYGKDLIEESSLKITYASESPFFPFLPVVVVPHVALASRVHLQIVKKIEKGSRQNNQRGFTSSGITGPVNYFEILSKDYRALHVLSKRFKRVSVFYGSLLQEIGEILQRHPADTVSQKSNNVEDNALLGTFSPISSSIITQTPKKDDSVASGNIATSQPSPSPSLNQEYYFADPFFTHEGLQQMFSPTTYGDLMDENSEFSFGLDNLSN